MADVQISSTAAGASTGEVLAPPAPVAGTDSARNSAGAAAPAAPAAEAAKADFPNALQTPGAVKSAVKNANQALAAIGTQLVFVFDDQEQHFAVKLLDVQTQKVVKEIPSAAMPATAHALTENPVNGALVNTKV
jgi:uncharacterized FlaG/YvyC family protein